MRLDAIAAIYINKTNINPDHHRSAAPLNCFSVQWQMIIYRGVPKIGRSVESLIDGRNECDAAINFGFARDLARSTHPRDQLPAIEPVFGLRSVESGYFVGTNRKLASPSFRAEFASPAITFR